jgi:hypothetical protein
MYPTSTIEGLRSDTLRGLLVLVHAGRRATASSKGKLGTADIEMNRQQCRLLTTKRKTSARVECYRF